MDCTAKFGDAVSNTLPAFSSLKRTHGRKLDPRPERYQAHSQHQEDTYDLEASGSHVGYAGCSPPSASATEGCGEGRADCRRPPKKRTSCHAARARNVSVHKLK